MMQNVSKTADKALSSKAEVRKEKCIGHNNLSVKNAKILRSG